MPVMIRWETPAQHQPHSTSGDVWQVRFNTLSVERDHPTDRLSTNAEDSDDGDEKQLVQTGPLLDVGRSNRLMGRERPFDGDERSLLPLFRLTDDVNRATCRCSREEDAEEASQQEHHIRDTDDVRSTEHGARHPDAARHGRPTQLQLFDSEEEGGRLRLSTPSSYLEASSRPMAQEMADQ